MSSLVPGPCFDSGLTHKSQDIRMEVMTHPAPLPPIRRLPKLKHRNFQSCEVGCELESVSASSVYHFVFASLRASAMPLLFFCLPVGVSRVCVPCDANMPHGCLMAEWMAVIFDEVVPTNAFYPGPAIIKVKYEAVLHDKDFPYSCNELCR